MLEELRLGQIASLLGVMEETTLHDVEHIRRVHSRNSLNFDRSLDFCLDIEIVRIHDARLFLTTVPKVGDIGWQSELTRRLLSGDGDWCRRFRSFLSDFHILDGVPQKCFQPHEPQVDTEIRNLTMELGHVRFIRAASCYVLTRELFIEYLESRPKSTSSPGQLQRALSRRSQIGHEAELAAIAVEKERLGDEYVNQIRHVALEDTTLGYDIASLTVSDSALPPLPRLIEVKAVPSGDQRFYWSSNERASAQRFGDWYFLYLVPVIRGVPKPEDTKIIRDPMREVMASPDVWSVEVDVVLCSLSSDNQREYSNTG